MLFSFCKRIFYNSIISGGISHKEMVIAAAIAPHIHIIALKHLDSFPYCGSPVEKKTDSHCCADSALSCLLVCLLLI